MNLFYIAIMAFGTISAQTILKKGLLLLGGVDFSTGVIAEILRVMHSPYVVGALVFQGIIALFWIYILSKVKLVYLFTMSGAFFYILLALTTWIFLGERLSLIQWIGLFMISFGIICFNFQSL